MKWVFLLAAVLLASCGEDNFGGDGSNLSSRSYEFQENGCSTGKIFYGDDADYCAKLKDETVNKGCARGLRRGQFQAANCPGIF